MSGGGRQCLQGRRHHFGDLVVADLPRRARTGFLRQAVQPPLGKTLAPCRHRQAGDVEPVGNGNVAQTLRRKQNNLRPHRIRPGGLPAARPRLQFVPLCLVQLNVNRGSPGHANLPNPGIGKVNHATRTMYNYF